MANVYYKDRLIVAYDVSDATIGFDSDHRSISLRPHHQID